MGRKVKDIDADLLLKADEAFEGFGLSGRIAWRLQAIRSLRHHSLNVVSSVIGIDRSRIKAWVKRFSEEGLAGLEDRPRKPKRSKLSEAQKAEVIRWVDTGRNHAGRDINWTLEKLRQSIEDEFGIRMGINTLWVFIRKEGYSFKRARPKHVQGDVEAQEQFKKNSRAKPKKS